MKHILVRFGLHFISSLFLTLAAYFALRFAHRKKPNNQWLPGTWKQTLLFSAIIVAGFMPWREPWDVSAGQSLVKVVFDDLSWISGAAISVFGLYRLKTERE